jgi:glyoxylase-like metal-dependent hydrolase (beta-lactamase superfamily II)
MLMDSLAAREVRPDQVDAVLMTHMHPDHVGWNCTEVNGELRPTFPNARYVSTPAEWKRWVTVEAGFVLRHLLPLEAAGQLDLVEDGYEPAPGVSLLATPGHTPGHVSVLVYGGGEGAVITGDLMHHPIEVEHPDWSPSADDDPDLSARSRLALVERVEAEGLTLLGGHFPEGQHAGRVLRVEGRRRFRPFGA